MPSRPFSALLRATPSRLAGTASALGKPSALRPISTTPSLLTRGPGGDGPSRQPKIMLEDQQSFGFIRHNPRPLKPRKVGVTEIRGPYYSVMGKRYLQDVLET